ncbi:TrmH family RNA methyltransferase [Bdellovibrio svalbardensis]|uniref:tRNA (guanosine(18)-2'-O)-methyltransferase n=1 Tax=Bdellovibrio svalbardensis TaxID=2972972 RepID=A0ABT6DPJ1_9BACT|nr:RNA methyltransferase [Bdellovibrio svalbardensis]MDG0817834.1 RNA methyltransferase [Bdellovibrio svalbardensis]
MFPYGSDIEVNTHLQVNHQVVLEKIGPLLTDERRQKIDKVVAQRNFDTAVVLESIYDRGNVSAVMRSAEGLGFGNFHVIETSEKFKESNRVTQGADKWVETKKWKKTTDCVKSLKAEGYKIFVTHLDARSKPLHEIDFSGKTALVLGNERDGVSPEMIEAADATIIIPMSGFVQSFNISVAGALALYHISQDRLKRLGTNASLTEEEQAILRAHYYMRTQDSSYKVLTELFDRGAIV